MIADSDCGMRGGKVDYRLQNTDYGIQIAEEKLQMQITVYGCRKVGR